MNAFIVIFLLFSSQPVYSLQNPGDTIIQGVTVKFNYTKSIFPVSWQSSPINAKGKPIAVSEINRSKSIIVKALKKYPLSLLQKNLSAVYFLRQMEFYGVGYGGTNTPGSLYLTNDGASMGYTDLYLEQTFHHEYSSILFRNYTSYFNEEGWKNANLPGFIYNDPEDGVGAIRNNLSSQDLDTVLCEKGFLTQYSQSGMENDINTFAQNLFSPSEGFWKLVDRYPLINKKVKLLIGFYSKIDPAFTEEYFRQTGK